MVTEESLKRLKREVRGLLMRGGFKIATHGLHHIMSDEAKASVARAQEFAKSENDRDKEMGTCASAIMCASSACEWSLSERIAYMTEFIGNTQYVNVRQIKDPSERWKKYMLLHAPSFRPGSSSAFQALISLFALRNHIVHRHARALRLGDWPESLTQYITRGHIPADKDKIQNDWIEGVLTVRTANWAISTAERWLHMAKKYAPLSC